MKTTKQGYKYIQHTADFGISVWSKTLKGLFKIAARALIKSAVQTSKVEHIATQKLSLNEDTLEELFKAWLSQILFLFSSKGKIFTKIKFIELTETSLKAELSGDVFSESKHRLITDLKAITYHQFYVRKSKKGYEAKFIVDV